ncbi:hypothetical protein GH714_013667 [Hevea brasiliensis]|uniref:Uncharacterized protein n=1 Tax=Hevea brasiliensis TaxID=3981 RepID=A0A6A6MKL1_HEVBR|nr:hypothetical protein GH714_013667 [Hevea brasiliensis]
MIKRRFYREEHGDRDAPSLDSSSSDSSSSSSSDSEVEAEATKESEDHAVVAEPKENDEFCSSSSVYESKDISADDIDVDLAGFTNEDDGTGNEKQIPVGPRLSSKHGAGILKKEFNGEAQKESEPADMPDFRHARSAKLLKENRLKAMLNSDGEIENQETPTEMHNRIVALAENKSKKKNKGRQRQKKRSRTKKGREILNMEKTRGSTKAPAKKRHKSEN